MDASLERLTRALADRYAIEREIGSGGMATVYLAQDLKHNRQVAVKVLDPDLAETLGAARFLREIETAANLTHPHILPLHDSGEADNLLFFVMPLIEGESLRERLDREKQLPIEDAIQITGQIADALAYAHERGVVHRDVKPENILLEAGHAVLADFGVAQAVAGAEETRLTQKGMSVGTPAYMSPEQAAGDRGLDGRSDQYALGCVLYEMLAGHPPFMGSTMQSVIRQHLAVQPTPVTVIRPTVPDGIVDALNRALAKSPADRFRTTKEFVTGLLAGGGSISIRGRRGRTKALVYGGVVVLGLVTAAVIGSLRPPEEDLWREKRIAIFPLDNETGDPMLDDLGLSVAEEVVDLLTRGEQLEGLDVQTLVQARVSLGEGGTTRQAALDLGTGVFTRGVITASGDSIVLRVWIARATTGERLMPVIEAGGLKTDKEAVEDELVQRVSGALLVVMDEEAAYWIPDPITYEAAQEYFAAQERKNAGDREKEIIHYREAYRLDSTFLVALVGMAVAHIELGQYHEADSLLQIIEPRKDELAPHPRTWVEDLSAGLRGDREGQYEVWLSELGQRPEKIYTRYMVGNRALTAGHPEEAHEALSQMNLDHPGHQLLPLSHRWLARACHFTRRFHEELEVVRKGLELFPDDLRLRRYEIRALAAVGRVDEVPPLLDSLVALGGADGVTSHNHFLRLAVDLHRLGYEKEAQHIAERAIQWYQSRDPVRFRAAEAGAWLFLNQPGKALPLTRELRAENPNSMEYRGLHGVALAGVGEWEDAEAESDWLAGLDRRYLSGQNTFLRAAIMAHLGREETAVNLLLQALEEGLWWGGLPSDPILSPLWGYEPFDRILYPGIG
jgi:tetratricopeptide (TPR) repeat protein